MAFLLIFFFILLGSIAEREHLKWQNAAPIENNPYSSDALLKRLEDKHVDHTFDLGVIDDSDTNPESPSYDRLEDVFKAEVSNHKRYNLIISFASHAGFHFPLLVWMFSQTQQAFSPVFCSIEKLLEVMNYARKNYPVKILVNLTQTTTFL